MTWTYSGGLGIAGPGTLALGLSGPSGSFTVSATGLVDGELDRLNTVIGVIRPNMPIIFLVRHNDPVLNVNNGPDPLISPSDRLVTS
jgi:hypothetical protein